jgi:hypothetical protein
MVSSQQVWIARFVGETGTVRTATAASLHVLRVESDRSFAKASKVTHVTRVVNTKVAILLLSNRWNTPG